MTDKLVDSIQDLLETRYGVRCTYRESEDDLEVGVAIQLLRPANPRRIALVMLNMSANNVFVAPGPYVGADHGIMLVPNGGTITLNYREDLILPSINWYALASGANSDFYWLEVEIY